MFERHQLARRSFLYPRGLTTELLPLSFPLSIPLFLAFRCRRRTVLNSRVERSVAPRSRTPRRSLVRQFNDKRIRRFRRLETKPEGKPERWLTKRGVPYGVNASRCIQRCRSSRGSTYRSRLHFIAADTPDSFPRVPPHARTSYQRYKNTRKLCCERLRGTHAISHIFTLGSP